MTYSINKDKGHFAETHAAAYLRRKGYEILNRNYAYRGGELDIIARDNGKIIFVEVKSVWNALKGRPESRVKKNKQFKLWRTACHFLHFNGGFETPCRFDVIAVNCNFNSFTIRHFENAFEGSYVIPECL